MTRTKNYVVFKYNDFFCRENDNQSKSYTKKLTENNLDYLHDILRQQFTKNHAKLLSERGNLQQKTKN